MPRLLASREVIAILEKNGFNYKSQRGSHTKYTKDAHTVIVPHPKKQIPLGTLFSIMRQSGLTKEVFYQELQ